MKKDVMNALVVASILGSAAMFSEPYERKVPKRKPRKCRTSEQVERRKKNRISNRSRAKNFKRSK